MRTLETAVADALASGRVVARDFIWLTARNRSSGALESAGFWSDVGTVTAPVVDAFTGATVSRDYSGSGRLIEIGDVPLIADLSVRTVTVRLSQIDAAIADLVRGYDPKYQPIQLHRGIFDPETRSLIEAAVPRFAGFVDDLTITTPGEGQEGGIELNCVSHTRELTRVNPDVRSDASQQARSTGDRFYRYTGVVGAWELYWGTAQGKAA